MDYDGMRWFSAVYLALLRLGAAPLARLTAEEQKHDRVAQITAG